MVFVPRQSDATTTEDSFFSLPMHDLPSAIVHFEGNWSTGERELITTAAREAEAAGLPDPSSVLGAPWVATRQTLGDTQLYMASRQKGSSALMDRCAEGLAARIRRYAEQGGVAPSESVSAASDSETVFQLVYESMETESMTETDLRALLQTARAKNDALGVTGLLLYAHGRFLQVLEGPEETVRRLYGIIREDPRHTCVETLLTTPAPTRTFPDWKMGLERPGAFVNLEDHSPFLQSGSLPAAVEPLTEVLKTLKKFRHDASQD